MCILFIKLDTNPASDAYKLILASNRDEYLDRPTKPASWWHDSPCILSGVDLMQGREGGTWLGMTKTGRVATLLNILQPQLDPNAKGRGALISNFLRGDEDCISYLQEIDKEGELYNGFNLIVMDLGRSNAVPKIGYYSNKTGREPELLSQGIHSFCNATIDSPWKKAVVGKVKFTEIVNSATTGRQEKLIEQLLQLLNDDTPYYDTRPNEQKGGQYYTDAALMALGTILVKLPNYGTRTNTVIVVDKCDQVTYIERTLQEPIDVHNLKWITNRYTFNLHVDHAAL